jgi:hypothetical protein
MPGCREVTCGGELGNSEWRATARECTPKAILVYIRVQPFAGKRLSAVARLLRPQGVLARPQFRLYTMFCRIAPLAGASSGNGRALTNLVRVLESLPVQ